MAERGPEKPAFGQPGNGCGFCCAAEPCRVAQEYIPGHGPEGPYQALELEDGRFWCGMVRHSSRYMGLPNDWADAVLSEMIGTPPGASASSGHTPELREHQTARQEGALEGHKCANDPVRCAVIRGAVIRIRDVLHRQPPPRITGSVIRPVLTLK